MSFSEDRTMCISLTAVSQCLQPCLAQSKCSVNT